MKKLVAILISICSTATLYAAGDGISNVTTAGSSASQTIQLILTDQIEIGFVSTGGIVNMPFTSVNNFANGVESADQQIRVSSNRNFEVKMQANADYFTYNGSSTQVAAMRVQDVLSLKVSGNSTGGQVSNSFLQYQNVSTANNNILNDCSNGGAQTFSVRYRANPGFQYPAGNYTVNMVYTATQK